jgi:hypothetical protein
MKDKLMTIREELDFDLILDKINNIFLKNHLTYIECLGLLDLMKEIILDEFRNGEKRMTNKTTIIQKIFLLWWTLMLFKPSFFSIFIEGQYLWYF